jgi:ABC-type nitrate/sulfonate/bicarbonate transport system permease component
MTRFSPPEEADAMQRRPVNIPGILALLLVAALWEALVRSGLMAFEYLPAPSGIAVAFFDVLASGELFVHTAHTIRSVLIGWLLACAIGGALGLLLGLSSFARRYLLASLEVLRPLPAIAFLPVSLLLFSFSLTTEVIVIVYASIWPMFVNTMGGLLNVASRLYDVGLTLQLSRPRILTKVLIPAAAPAIVVGCRLSLGTALVMAIIAEMIGNPHGLGHAVVTSLQAMQPARMFAYVIFVGVLAIVLNAGLLFATQRLLASHHREAVQHG